jgi:hypothetical protein
MPDAALAIVFIVMIIAPCAIALLADERRDKKAANARPDAETRPLVVAQTASLSRQLPAQRPYRAPALSQARQQPEVTQPASAFTRQVIERAEAEALLARAAAAKAKAAELAEAARAAALKAQAAAEAVEATARGAAEAHAAASQEREAYARAATGTTSSSAEHKLPETHPSLDFPRSRQAHHHHAA